MPCGGARELDSRLGHDQRGQSRRVPSPARDRGADHLVDNDKPNPKTGKRAGRDAALELIRRYTEAGFDPKRDIKVIYPLTEGEDVNDLVRKHRGVA